MLLKRYVVQPRAGTTRIWRAHKEVVPHSSYSGVWGSRASNALVPFLLHNKPSWPFHYKEKKKSFNIVPQSAKRLPNEAKRRSTLRLIECHLDKCETRTTSRNDLTSPSRVEYLLSRVRISWRTRRKYEAEYYIQNDNPKKDPCQDGSYSPTQQASRCRPWARQGLYVFQR